MGRQLDYAVARQVLDEEFPCAEEMFRNTAIPDVPEQIVTATKRLFSSATQAFREALIGLLSPAPPIQKSIFASRT